MAEADLKSLSVVELAPGVSVRVDDLNFHFARSGGPGGQNVNKVNSKSELRVRPESLIGINGPALFRLKNVNANRMTVDGDLMIVADTERSQFANRQACLEKLKAFVQAAMVVPKVRRKTRPSAGSREKRLDSKKAHSQIKTQRRRNDYD